MIPLVLIFGVMLILKSPGLSSLSNPAQSTSIALGFILIFAFLFGKQINRLRLPQITGFILAGILCGPYLLKFLNVSEVKDLQLLDGLALSLIALTAGGEMTLKKLRGSWKIIVSIVFFQTLIIISGFLLFGWLGKNLFSIFSGLNIAQVMAISLLLGTLATATSPATTIAVITETQSKGKFTDLIISSAVVKDFFVIILFAFSLSISKFFILPSQAFDFAFLAHILKEIGISFGTGIAVGAGIVLYLRFIKKDVPIFILGIAFFTFQISMNYGYHPLLICLVAGFCVENFSSQGERLIHAIERISLPIYVVFFAISGASLNIGALRQSWILALICVTWRAVLKYAGTLLAVITVKEEKKIGRYAWAGFISQAGVTLGMVIIIEKTFPGWGDELRALVLAIIALNQIIGPVLLQKLFIKVGETGKKKE